jgi:hypothetical protein
VVGHRRGTQRRQGAPIDPTPVRQRWCQLSFARGFPSESAWSVPAVDAFLEALSGSGADPLAASDRLGRNRARGGVRLVDALIDVASGLDVAATEPSVRPALIGAVAAGWADEVSSWLGRTTAGCVDMLTDLVSRDYLRTRLRELYAEAATVADWVTHRRALVVVVVRSSAEALVLEQRMMAVGQVLGSVFSRGETLARVGPGTAVALVRRNAGLRDLLVALQLELRWSGLTSAPTAARLWLESLPTDGRHVDTMLDDLATA